MEKKYKCIDRLFEYLESKGIAPTKFEKDIGLSNGYLSIQRKRNADLGESIILKIINNCHDLNPNWFVFNKGTMNNTVEYSAISEPPPNYKIQDCALCKEKDKMIESLIKTNESQLKQLNSLTGVIESLTSQSSKKNEESGEKKRKAS